MVKDVDAKRKLVSELISLSRNKDLQAVLSSNIQKLSVDNAAVRIADLALNLIE